MSDSTNPPAAEPRSGLAGRQQAYYASLVALFCVILVLTNIIGVKLFQVFADGRPAWMPGRGPLTLTTGILTYPFTFLCTDVVAEIWGRRRAQHMVWLGFGMSVLMLGLIRMAEALPPSPIWQQAELGLSSDDMQSAFGVTFMFPGLLLFASMLAYLVAQLFDVHLYHFWWRLTRGGHMWIRNNGSTSISQLVDTIIVNSIFLRGAFGMAWADVWTVIASVYACKLVLAALDTPLIYLCRSVLRRRLGIAADPRPAAAPLEG